MTPSAQSMLSPNVKAEPQSRGTSYTLAKSNGNITQLLAQQALLDLNWQGEQWQGIASLAIDNFLAESSEHQPLTELKLQYSEQGIFGLFRAQDNYVQCVQTQFQSRVCRDSCVEIYFQPMQGVVQQGQKHASYFSLEISGNGTLLSYAIRDCVRQGDAFVDYTKLSLEDSKEVIIQSTLPAYVYPEITQTMEWRLGFFLPFKVIEKYLNISTGQLTNDPMKSWRMNAFKCTEDSSHPHWSSWQKCSEFNFHLPKDFGEMLFAQ